MTSAHRPRVSVGLPVADGENFVEEAVLSVLGQDFADLELVISDNASTDRTADICRAYAAKDERVRYVRQPRNLGAGPNYNLTFGLARGEYFKWMPHDDVCRPQFVSRCVGALDADPSVVLAYPRALDIDEHGSVIGPRDHGLRFDADRPSARFRATMTQAHAMLAIMGLARADVLRRTALLGAFPGADRPLLAELALHGRIVELAEELFLHRQHARRSVGVRGGGTSMGWWDPTAADKAILPFWRRFAAYLGAIRRAPIGTRERLACYAFMGRWMVDKRVALLREMRDGLLEAPRGRRRLLQKRSTGR